VLDLLERYPSPAQLAATSEKTLANRLTKLAPRMGKGLAAEILQALSEQAVIVPGTQAATIVMPRLARQLAALRKQRDEIASEVERLVHAHPLWPVLTSMPGVGVRTPPDSSLKSLTKPSLQPRISPPTPALLRSLDARVRPSVANTHPGGATRCSSERSSSLPLPPCEIRSRGTITLARSSRANATIRRSSLLPDDAATCCSPCCATVPSTNQNLPLMLDESHRGTPRHRHRHANLLELVYADVP
jgi:hypothetical protein